MRTLLGLCLLLLSGCPAEPARDAGSDGGARDAPSGRDAPLLFDVPIDDADRDAPILPCSTRVTYGSSWIHEPGHPQSFDDAEGVLSWDGVCVDDGADSFATLSNGWRPYFAGHGACVIALDRSAACPSPPPCGTRITYGAGWRRPADHPADFDDVTGIVTHDGACLDDGAAYAQLSNGWAPHFDGECAVSLRYEQCGGLFANPVIDRDCPDPGVVFDGAEYLLTCTSGNAADAFPIFGSPDLVSFSERGHVFPAGTRPSWASGDFWAPEIHRVGAQWVVYYSARNAADGRLAVGAATASSPLGPYTDLGRPLVRDPAPGVIDAHYVGASDGRHYLLYKVDGNDVGAPTPILIQEIGSDGTTLLGAPSTLITNDRPWEGALVEGPWMIEEAGRFFLFYSANGYASPSYAIGVARAASPLGPFEKAAEPILTTRGAFAGPGHGAVVRGPRGDWLHVYHAWRADRVGRPPGRMVLVDRVAFEGGWPRMLAAPSSRSQPVP